MPLTPIYAADKLEPAYHLRYAWTGWPTAGTRFPAEPNANFFGALETAWQSDQLNCIATNWNADKIQFTFSTMPTVSPTFFVARVKGRLQHALRIAGTPVKFSRKVAFRAIGDNHSTEIERYLSQQVTKEGFADERFAERLRQFTKMGDRRRFADPIASNSGRYWYNLHIVLVTAGRGKITSLEQLRELDRAIDGTASKHGYDVVMRSWLLDHVHLGLRGNINDSPEEIALALLNNTAYAVGQNAIWQRGYDAGTFSEYDTNAAELKLSFLPASRQGTCALGDCCLANQKNARSCRASRRGDVLDAESPDFADRGVHV